MIDIDSSSRIPPGANVDLVREARRLQAARKWQELADLEIRVDPVEFERAPELNYLFGDALRRTGHPERAKAHAEAAERGAIRMIDRRLQFRAMNLIGMIEFELGSLTEAEARFSELLDRATIAGDDEFAARASNNLGVIANVRDRAELALTAYQRALAAYTRLGYVRGLAQTHYNLGISYRDLGFTTEADTHYTRAMEYARTPESEDVLALAETERAYLRALAGDGRLAESICQRALNRMERMGDPAGVANATRVLAAAAEAKGELDLALERADRALEILDTHPDQILRGEIQRDRGRLFHLLGHPQQAALALLDAIRSFESLGATGEAAATREILRRIPGQGE